MNWVYPCNYRLIILAATVWSCGSNRSDDPIYSFRPLFIRIAFMLSSDWEYLNLFWHSSSRNATPLVHLFVIYQNKVIHYRLMLNTRMRKSSNSSKFRTILKYFFAIFEQSSFMCPHLITHFRCELRTLTCYRKVHTFDGTSVKAASLNVHSHFKSSETLSQWMHRES